MLASTTGKSRWVWSAPEVVGVAPPARTGHSAVLLPDGHTIVIHGGWDPEDEGGACVRVKSQSQESDRRKRETSDLNISCF